MISMWFVIIVVVGFWYLGPTSGLVRGFFGRGLQDTVFYGRSPVFYTFFIRRFRRGWVGWVGGPGVGWGVRGRM